MKQHLLSLFALAGAMFVSTSVAAWDEPVRPTPPAPPAQFQGTFVEPAEGGQYYIYNVGAGLFLGGGQTWGTRGIVLCDSVISVSEEAKINNTSGNTTANYVLPFELAAGPADGQYYINVLANTKATSGAGHFVGEDGAQTWIDGDEGRNSNFGAWTIEAYEGGYMIKNVNASEVKYLNEEGEVDRAFGVDGNNSAGTWATTWTDLYITLPKGNSTRPLLVWQFVSADDFEAVKEYSQSFKEKYASDEYQAKMKAYQDALEAYNAKTQLLAALQDAEAAGVSTTAAETVYNNANATLAEVNKAIAALRAEIARGDYDFTGASEDEPLDVTEQVLKNPTFDDNIDGWTITVGGQNLMRQARTDGVVNESKNWVQITNFIEAWIASSTHLGDGTISQTVYGLPAGKYKLECDAMATLQGGSPSPEDAVEGAYIFIEGENSETREPIKSPDGQPKHWSVIFVNDGSNYLTFGLKVENTTANWISADNFRLWFYGATDRIPEYLVLSAAVNEAKEIDLSTTRAEATKKTAFSDAIAAADAALANSAENAEILSAANTALKEANAALQASIIEYAAANTFISKIDATSESIATQWPTLSDELYEWMEALSGKYQAGTLTSEEIAGLDANLQQKIRDFLSTPDVVKEGDDLTFLLANPDFSNGTTGWTIENRQGGNFGTSFGGVDYAEIECWQGTFDVYQVLPDMPAGAYKITVQGFAHNYSASEPSTVELYAGISTAKFMDRYAEYSTERLYGDGTGQFDDEEHTYDDGTVGYVPGGMAGAAEFFKRENPATGLPWYTNEVTIIMKEAGDLRIGVRGSDTHSWVLWDNFHLTYSGAGAENYYAEIDRLLNNLALAGEAEDAFLTAQTQKYLTELPEKAAQAKLNADADACIALIGEIDEAIKYITQGNEKGAELGKLWEDFDIRKDNIQSSNTTYPALLEDINASLNDPASIADNDKIDELIQSMKDGWAGYVLADANDATEANPFDCTDIIYNTNYVHPVDGVPSATGWTAEPAPGLNNEEAEFFNKNFNIFQTINGLRAGYYTFSVEGFYRAGGYAEAATAQRDSTDARNAYMYTVVGNDTVDVRNLHSIFDGAQESPIANTEVTVTLKNEAGEEAEMYIPNNMEDANVYLTTTDEEDNKLYTNAITVKVAESGSVTIGIRKNVTLENDWSIFTDWKAYYLGTEEPTGVNGISNKSLNTRKEFFCIDGRQQNSLRRGINIVRMSDGSVQKVLVR